MSEAALIDAHMRSSYDRQARTGAYLARVGETIGYGDEFVSEAVDTVLAAQVDQAGATWSYLEETGLLADPLGRTLGVDPPLDEMVGAATHAGTPLETVYRRPGKLLAELEELDVPDAAARVAGEVDLLASSDVAQAGRQAEQTYGNLDKRVVGWRRVPNVGACDFCRLIATQRYKKRDLAPAHRSCHCGTAAIHGDVDPGQVIDRKELDRLNAKGPQKRYGKRDPAAARASRARKVSDQPLADDTAKLANAARAADDKQIAQLAELHGVTPDEVVAAKGRVKTVRQQLRDEAAVVQQEAFDELWKWNDVKLKRPARRATDRGGEYDWLEQLDQRERARLSRKWYDEKGLGPDELADTIYGPGSDVSIDDAIDEWLRVNRQYEAAGAIRRGKLPSSRAYSGQIDADDLLPNASADGYSPRTILGGDDIEAAAHIAGVEKDLAAREALDYLETAANPFHGDAPYQMSYQAWEAEVRTLEYGLREFPGEMAANAKERLRELVPELLDDGLDYEDLYARIIDTAHRANEEVADYAYIPWQ